MTLCKTPELACEVTLQPISRFDLDAAIIFSDILTIPDAMGLGLNLVEKVGPVFDSPINSAKDVARLPLVDPQQDLDYVLKTISMVKHELADRIPVLGFSGSPWTLATYMIEGGVSKSFSKTKAFMYNQEEAFTQLMSKLTQAVIDYLDAQIQAGVNAVMLFDTWGGVLTPHDYHNVSLSCMNTIIKALREKHGDKVPIVVFSKGAAMHLSGIANSGCDAIGVDWSISLKWAREQVGDRVALQGNLDPGILLAPPHRIKQEVDKVLRSFGKGSGHVFNLGHGITPDVDPQHVQVLLEAVRELSPAYHT